MKTSNTLSVMIQEHLLIMLTNSNQFMPIKTDTPNNDYPAPWHIELLAPNISSIVSAPDSRGVNQTIVSMIPVDVAECVLEEIK